MGVTRLARRPLGVAAITAVLLAVLAGCAAEPVPRPLPSGPILVTTVPVAPTSRIAPSCEQLVGAADLDSVLTIPVKQVDAVTTTAALLPEMSPVWSVREAGGIYCQWSNAPEWGGFKDQPAAFHGLTLEILPQAANLWNRFQSFTLASERNFGCSTSNVGSCSADVHTPNDVWLHANLVEPGAADASATRAKFDALIDRVTALLAASTVAPASWSPPTGSLKPNTPCSAVMTNAGLKAALGVDPVVIFPLDDWTLEDAADFRSAKLACTWTYGGAEPGVVSISWLGGGAWAWASNNDPRLALGQPKPFSIFGIGDEGGAWMRCNTNRTTCATDIVVKGNWVELSLSGTGGAAKNVGGSRFDASIASLAIAEEIVHRIQGEATT